jgi:hypothetical protein
MAFLGISAVLSWDSPATGMLMSNMEINKLCIALVNDFFEIFMDWSPCSKIKHGENIFRFSMGSGRGRYLLIHACEMRARSDCRLLTDRGNSGRKSGRPFK